jgi:hypothetical protein
MLPTVCLQLDGLRQEVEQRPDGGVHLGESGAGRRGGKTVGDLPGTLPKGQIIWSSFSPFPDFSTDGQKFY